MFLKRVTAGLGLLVVTIMFLMVLQPLPVRADGANGANVSFSSSEQGGVTSNLGTITAFGDQMVLPRTRGPNAGSYPILYTPAGGYIFVSWETTGGCSVQDVNAASTTLIVVSDCSVTAIYRLAPIPEYPFGLPLLAILTIIGYGLVRRRTRNDKT